MNEEKTTAEMTEEQQQEEQRRALMARNKETVAVVVYVLLWIALLAWTATLVLDIVRGAEPIHMLYHGAMAAVTALVLFLRNWKLPKRTKQDAQSEENTPAEESENDT